MNIKKVKNILVILEQQVDNATKLLRENSNDDAALLAMAKKHFVYETKINELYDQLQAEEEKMQANDKAIFDAVSRIKGKSIKFGRILIKIQRTKNIIKGKNATSWKSVVDGVKETFQEEERIIKEVTKLEKANFHPAQDTVRIDNDLIIKKESVEARALISYIEKETGKKVVLSENIFTSIKNVIVNIYNRYFKPFSQKVDALGEKVNSFMGTSVGEKMGTEDYSGEI